MVASEERNAQKVLRALVIEASLGLQGSLSRFVRVCVRLGEQDGGIEKQSAEDTTRMRADKESHGHKESLPSLEMWRLGPHMRVRILGRNAMVPNLEYDTGL